MNLIRSFLFILSVMASCCWAGPASKKVLFLGNSYTAQSKGALQKLLGESSYKQTEFVFITRGGATLQQHLAHESTRKRIQEGNWDVVVLQDQSQVPGLPGRHGQSFQTSVDGLTTLIRKAGAEPVLFMTWGRRDGDGRNKSIYPDYATMQRKLSEAYLSAAQRNKLQVAAVGTAWAAVRNQDPALGTSLYRGDGSHPSAKGATLVAAVMMHTLFGDSLASFKPPKGVSAKEWALLKASATSQTP